ncbi:MAG: thiamine-phosphate kinase [Thermoplasmata archaeon]
MADARRLPEPAIREREFHVWLARTLPSGRSGPLPLGDDAAAVRPPSGAVAVVTIDALVEGTHFHRDSPAGRVGRAATAVSLSDLASKGALPSGVLLAMIVPPSTPRRWAEGVVRGAEAEAADFGAHVLGGDTKAGPARTVVSMAIGWGRPGRLAPRAGARPGDVLVTTGTVGRGGLAFDRLRKADRPRRILLREILDVRPRVREGAALARWAHAMLDTSDGLAESCRLMAEASRVRTLVDEQALPYEPGLTGSQRSLPGRRAIAFFGGDYELLAALPPGRVDAAGRAVRAVGGRLTPIGSVRRGRGAILSTGRGEIAMPPCGWDPFGHRLRRGRAP